MHAIHQTSTQERRRRSSVQILFAERTTSIANALRAALVREGFDRFQLVGNAGGLTDALQATEPDLLVLDMELPGDDPCQVVRRIREGHLGSNPFLPIVMTCANPTRSSIAPALAAGADDVVARPLSPGLLLKRIGLLVEQRKAFVVTSDYIGPERRDAPRDDEAVDLLEVPNTLRQKVRGEANDQREIVDAISDAQQSLNTRRLVRHSRRVESLVTRMLAAYRSGEVDEGAAHDCRQLVMVAEDTVRRLSESPFRHAGEICANLVMVAQTIRRDHPAPGERTLALLEQLSEAMMLSFDEDQERGARFASQINEQLAERFARDAGNEA